MIRAWWVAGLLLPAVSGCFSFSDSTVAPPGETVRVTLGTTRPMPDGSQGMTRLEGRVVQSTLGSAPGGMISLEWRKKEPIGNFREYMTLDTVQIAEADMSHLEVRRLSWIKSGIGALVVGALAYAMYDNFYPSAERR